PIYFAATTEWGKHLVNSLFTLGLMIGISVNDITVGTTVANLGMTETIFPHPVFHGDTIRVETTVLSVRESRSKPDRRLVEFEHRAYNQNDVPVAKCVRPALMLNKPTCCAPCCSSPETPTGNWKGASPRARTW